MTDSEKAEKYANECCGLFKEMHWQDVKWAVLYGLSERRKESKKENEQLKCDLYNTDANLQHITIEYEKENAELREQIESLVKINIKAQTIIAGLKAQIEKMKCCKVCKNRKGWKGEKPCLDCKFNQFGEGTEDKWELAE